MNACPNLNCRSQEIYRHCRCGRQCALSCRIPYCNQPLIFHIPVYIIAMHDEGELAQEAQNMSRTYAPRSLGAPPSISDPPRLYPRFLLTSKSGSSSNEKFNPTREAHRFPRHLRTRSNNLMAISVQHLYSLHVQCMSLIGGGSAPM